MREIELQRRRGREGKEGRWTIIQQYQEAVLRAKIPAQFAENKDYQWGTAITSNNQPDQYLFFRPRGTTYEDGDLDLTARKCNQCGNVQFFHD